MQCLKMFSPLILLGLMAGVSPGQSQPKTTHAVQYSGVKGFLTGLSFRTCPQSNNQPAPQIIQQGSDPGTISLLGNVLQNQGQMMNQMGRIEGRIQGMTTPPSQPAPIIVNPAPNPAPTPAPTPIVLQVPPTTPIYPQGIPYVPQTLPQGYNPQPLPQQYAPQPLPQQYAPQPLPQIYQPQPLPHNYNPQIIVQPGGGTAPTPQPLPGAPAPQTLPQGYNPNPAPRSGPPGYQGQPPGIDFRYFGPTTPNPMDPNCKNGSPLPPASQPQVYSRQRDLRQVRN